MTPADLAAEACSGCCYAQRAQPAKVRYFMRIPSTSMACERLRSCSLPGRPGRALLADAVPVP